MECYNDIENYDTDMTITRLLSTKLPYQQNKPDKRQN